jgi:hypothetical protein
MPVAWSQENSADKFSSIEPGVLPSHQISKSDGYDFKFEETTKIDPVPREVEGSRITPVPAAPRLPAKPKIADRKYFLLNGLHAGLTVFDVEMTQHCIDEHRCQELNPILPSSHVGKLAVNFAFVGYGVVTSYWLKKHNSKIWWLPPIVGSVGHSIGVATGFEHQ